jgi:hypothetical protein
MPKPKYKIERKYSMTIKQFLIIVFCVLFSFSIYINIRYLIGVEFQKNNQPIEYENYSIIETNCHDGGKMGSSITISFNRKKYFVDIPSGGICYDIADGKIKPKLYYLKVEDKVFLENRYVPFPFVYLTCIASVILPLFGFIFYRKELNNSYKTM